MTNVGGSSAADAGRVGSSIVRMMRIGSSGQSSSGASCTSQGLSVGLFPWLNQSRIMNCSHAATRALTDVASMRLSRVIRARLTSRGLGRSLSSRESRTMRVSGMLRPKRVPAAPIRGSSRSL